MATPSRTAADEPVLRGAAVPQTPVSTYCAQLDKLAHDVIASSVECMKGDRAARNHVFKVLLAAYVSLFVVGLGAFTAAVVKGLMATTVAEAVTTGAFAGLSVGAFISLFLFRPLEKLKQNSIFLTWLNVTTTSYWTRHYYLNKKGLLDYELEEATQETLAHLNVLLHLADVEVDAHALEVSGARNGNAARDMSAD
jgi:hypothetical protein